LIASARNRRVVDLSVELREDLPLWWPGRGAGRSRHAYFKHLIFPTTQQRHLLDSNTGTHLVPPAYSLPRLGFEPRRYAPQIHQWLREYEAKYGPRGFSDVTGEKVPIEQTCGPMRIIDVGSLAGTTPGKSWPASPEVTPDILRAAERSHGDFRPGEIVVLRSGYSDRHCKPFPTGKACLEDPLNAKSEGWPALGSDAVDYLSRKGVRCVATDAPTLGGVDAKRALWTYWLLGSRGMVGVEYLTNVAGASDKDYFVFAALKIENCHGGPGRALVLR
jgi:kynurenine formamidase